MSIEAMTTKGVYLYRTNPKLPRQVQRRRNVHAAKWTDFSWHETPQEARAEVIRLGRETGEKA